MILEALHKQLHQPPPKALQLIGTKFFASFYQLYQEQHRRRNLVAHVAAAGGRAYHLG